MATKENVIKGLNKVLASTYALYLKTHNYHWNVTGPHFSQLHAMFEEQYNDLAEAVDEIAERIRALDEKVPGSFKTFDSASEISDGDHNADWKKMVKDLHGDHLKLNEILHSTMHTAEDADDEVTMDFMIERMDQHQKTAWMLKATVE